MHFEDHKSELPPGTVTIVLGTRPEIIKLAHVIRALGDAAAVVHTGQHYDAGLSATFLETFGIDEPSVFLGVGGMTRGGQIGSAVSALEEHLAATTTRAVIVQGDTNATLAGALAANAREVTLFHVEAGLRSHDRRMPEEHNRVVTDHLGDFLFAPTENATGNLTAEGIPIDRIQMTGNTVVEAMEGVMPDDVARKRLLVEHGLEPGRYVLSTFHRPENVDVADTFETIIEELAGLPLTVVLPLHPRSRSRAERFGLGRALEHLHVIDPIGYPEFLGLSAESAYLVSDSGGVQEEASIYKRPVIVVRRSTERPEVIGTFARLVRPNEIGETVAGWLRDPEIVHEELSHVPTPYGDGSASDSIVDRVVATLVSGV